MNYGKDRHDMRPAVLSSGNSTGEAPAPYRLASRDRPALPLIVNFHL
jgi:hypothetical protein